jgi:hypothetical protein
MNAIELTQLSFGEFVDYITADHYANERKTARDIQAMLIVRHDLALAMDKKLEKDPAKLRKLLEDFIDDPKVMQIKLLRFTRWQWKRKTKLQNHIAGCTACLDKGANPEKIIPSIGDIMLKRGMIPADPLHALKRAQLALRIQALLNVKTYGTLVYPYFDEEAGDPPDVIEAVRGFNMINTVYVEGKLLTLRPDEIAYSFKDSAKVDQHRSLDWVRLRATADKIRAWGNVVIPLHEDGLDYALDRLDMAGFTLGMPPFFLQDVTTLLDVKSNPKLYYQERCKLRINFFEEVQKALTGTDENEVQRMHRYIEFLGFSGMTRGELTGIFSKDSSNNFDECAWKIFNTHLQLLVYTHKFNKDAPRKATEILPPDIIVHHENVSRAMAPRSPQEMRRLLRRPGFAAA